MLISFKGTGKNQIEPGQESMGEDPVLSHCSLLRNVWPILTGVLEHCCEGETKCWFSIFSRAFPSDCILKATKDINVRRFHPFIGHEGP
jgi:hypothetical protein